MLNEMLQTWRLSNGEMTYGITLKHIDIISM